MAHVLEHVLVRRVEIVDFDLVPLGVLGVLDADRLLVHGSVNVPRRVSYFESPES